VVGTRRGGSDEQEHSAGRRRASGRSRPAGVSAEGEIGEARYGHIASAILKAAGRHDVRLVILGSSSRTDLPRIPLGSVSARLLHMVTRPVLIVPRADAPAQQA
jgi:nucleotide-binding universal stress UspA family protein